jgi:hypothetical protein
MTRKAQQIFTVLGVVLPAGYVVPDGGALWVAGTLSGDCRHLLCDAGEEGSWGHVLSARDWLTARDQAIDDYVAHMSGDLVSEVHVEVVATVDPRSRAVGRWGKRKAQRQADRAQRELTGGGGPLEFI